MTGGVPSNREIVEKSVETMLRSADCRLRHLQGYQGVIGRPAREPGGE